MKAFAIALVLALGCTAAFAEEEDDDKVPVNQDAVVVPIYFMGQLATNRRRVLGKLF